MLLTTIFITLLLLPVGSAIRFIAFYIIPAVFFIALLFTFLRDKFGARAWLGAAFGLFLIYETFFTANLLFLHAPDYGVRRLDVYFDSVFGGARPTTLPRSSNPRLDEVIQKFSANFPANLPPAGIIYDENLDLSPSLWLFSRRQYYQGIPIMPAVLFDEKLSDKNLAMFQGYNLYFVKTGAGAPLRQAGHLPYADDIEKFLQSTAKTKPELIIKSGDGQTAFTVYKFSIAASPSR